MERAIHGLVSGRYEWIGFTSVNAVRAVREKLEEYGLDARSFAGLKVAAVGPDTAEALVTFGVQLLMYLSPVVYPLNSLDGPFRVLIQLNPMTSVIEAFRFAFIGAGDLSAPLLGYTVGVTIVVLLLGLNVFRRVERRFVDIV